MNALDVKEDNQPLLEEEKLEKASFRADLEKIALLEEISWRQKSRVLYLKEGNSNTRFFHRMAKGGRVTLIKSTLSILPTYFLSLFPDRKSVV